MKPIRIGSASRIEIGYDGENGARAVVFDATKWMEEMPGCTAAITAQRADGKEYIAPDVTQDEAEKTITWTLTSAETMEGEGRAQLLWMDGERIAKQAIFTTVCHESLKSDATEIGVPEPVWAQKSMEAARKAEADAGRAEAAAARAEAAEEAVYAPSASATRVEGGVLVTVTDKTGTTSAVIRDGERGETGPQGEPGPQGIQGPAGADGKETVIDETLTQAGQAADAAKTGEAIGKLKNDLNDFTEYVNPFVEKGVFSNVVKELYIDKSNYVGSIDVSTLRLYRIDRNYSDYKYLLGFTSADGTNIFAYNSSYSEECVFETNTFVSDNGKGIVVYAVIDWEKIPNGTRIVVDNDEKALILQNSYHYNYSNTIFNSLQKIKNQTYDSKISTIEERTKNIENAVFPSSVKCFDGTAFENVVKEIYVNKSNYTGTGDVSNISLYRVDRNYSADFGYLLGFRDNNGSAFFAYSKTYSESNEVLAVSVNGIDIYAVIDWSKIDNGGRINTDSVQLNKYCYDYNYTNIIKEQYFSVSKVWKKWNAIGDSITWLNDNSSYKGYITRVCEMLGIESYVNHGTAGQKITDIKSIIQNSIDSDSDLITFFMGTNDFGKSVTIQSMKNACEIVFSSLINAYPTKDIFVILPIQRWNYVRDSNVPTDSLVNDIGISLREYCNAIKEVAEIYSITVIDLYYKSGIIAGENGNTTTYLYDGLHPNDSGFELISNALAKVFKMYLIN